MVTDDISVYCCCAVLSILSFFLFVNNRSQMNYLMAGRWDRYQMAATTMSIITHIQPSGIHQCNRPTASPLDRMELWQHPNTKKKWNEMWNYHCQWVLQPLDMLCVYVYGGTDLGLCYQRLWYTTLHQSTCTLLCSSTTIVCPCWVHVNASSCAELLVKVGRRFLELLSSGDFKRWYVILS